MDDYISLHYYINLVIIRKIIYERACKIHVQALKIRKSFNIFFTFFLFSVPF